MPPLLFGAPEEIRTPDPLVRSQVLYPAELPAHWISADMQANLRLRIIRDITGGDRGIRTLDTGFARMLP